MVFLYAILSFGMCGLGFQLITDVGRPVSVYFYLDLTPMMHFARREM